MTGPWLITGGCGFVGANLADSLLTEGQDVVILDNLSRVGAEANLSWLRDRHGTGWHFVQGDVRDAKTAARVVRETMPRVVAHLAGQVAMTTSIRDPRLDFEVNALGSVNVLEAVRLCSPSTIALYSSTNKVYGSLDHLRYGEEETRYTLLDYPEGLDESLPLDGRSPYGCSKLAADQYFRDYHRTYGTLTIVFRHSSMYGGRQFATPDQGWVGWFCQQALRVSSTGDEPLRICGTGKQVRDVLHASDLVQSYVKAAANIERTAGEVYNIGGGVANSMSLLELFALLETQIGCCLHVERSDWRPGDQKVFIASNQKARRDFGWAPGVDKATGIARMIDWCREVAGGV